MADVGDRVRVHVNLHKRNLSVMDPRTGLVVYSVDDITLTGVSFRVQPAALRRVKIEGVRAVCAYAVGIAAAVQTAPDVTGWDQVTFNPFTADTFMRNNAPVDGAPLVVFRHLSGWTPREQ